MVSSVPSSKEEGPKSEGLKEEGPKEEAPTEPKRLPTADYLFITETRSEVV